MAYLINCRVCKGKVSNEAVTCPHCGDPFVTNERKIKNDIAKGKICPECKCALTDYYCTNKKCRKYVNIEQKRSYDKYLLEKAEDERAEESIRSYLYALSCEPHQ